MTTLGRARGALIAAIALAALASCERAREVPDPDGGTGVHPEGWADPASADFHAKWFQAHRTDGTGEIGHLADCQKCHGADWAGGAVGVGCTGSSCHSKKGGPEFCGTCHGGDKGPMPTAGPFAGAHEIHKAFCNDCHVVPQQVSSPGHIDGKVDVVFSGLAVANGAKPVFDAATKTCSDVYCHAAASLFPCDAGTEGCKPKWEKSITQADCGFCHKTPPDSHARWAAKAPDQASCQTCHPSPAKPIVADSHIDAKLEVNDLTCWSCHGSPPDGAPAPDLSGSTDTTSPGVGAHRRHLDPALPGRIGKVVACQLCHTVPDAWWSPGHILDAAGKLDDAAPAEVTLPFGGTFSTTDPQNPTCVVACHFDQPRTWTADKPGTVPACTSCHGFPPLLLRDGTPHTQSPSDLAACLKCHPFSPATHVDGTIDLLP